MKTTKKVSELTNEELIKNIQRYNTGSPLCNYSGQDLELERMRRCI